MKDFNIGDHMIGQNHKPFIIAEMSGNHNQSLDKAIEIIERAHEAGADAIKLQTYTADTMTLNVNQDDFIINDKDSLWYGRHLYELYDEAHTPWEWHQALFDKARELGLICFSTPFDATAVDFLERLNAPCYKIASFENTDIHLIRKVAQTKKPMIISTGMASLADLALIVDTLKKEQVENYVLLKCTSAYPAKPKDANIMTIPHMQAMFDCHVGLSDHTLGIGVAVASVALGARVIEKHFCLSRNLGGVDADFSLEPDELALLVSESRRAFLSLGQVSYQCSETESKSKTFRRSIYFISDLTKGDEVKPEHIRCIRPGFGLSPKYWDDVVGKTLTKDVKKGMRVTFDCFRG